MFLKDQGMIIEIQKDITALMITACAAAGKLKEVDEYKKDLMKLYYPDFVTPEEKLMKEAAARLNSQDAVVKVGAKVSQKLTTEQANRTLGNA